MFIRRKNEHYIQFLKGKYWIENHRFGYEKVHDEAFFDYAHKKDFGLIQWCRNRRNTK